jgi:hypothetical protein
MMMERRTFLGAAAAGVAAVSTFFAELLRAPKAEATPAPEKEVEVFSRETSDAQSWRFDNAVVRLPGAAVGILVQAGSLSTVEYEGRDRIDVHLGLNRVIGPRAVIDEFRERLMDVTRPETICFEIGAFKYTVKHAVLSHYSGHIYAKDMALVERIDIMACDIEPKLGEPQ